MRPDSARTPTTSDSRRLIEGTRRLFEFSAIVAGQTQRQAARRAGRDLRSFRRMREVPSIELVAALGETLAWDAPVAVALAAMAAKGRSDLVPAARPQGQAERVDELLRADISDDAPALERIAGELARIAATPFDFAASIAVCARALAARGLVLDAMRGIAEFQGILSDLPADLTECDGAIPMRRACRACVLTVQGDAALGCPWEGAKARPLAPIWPDFTQETDDASRLRESSFTRAARAIASPCTDAATDLLRDLGRAMRSAGGPVDAAWVASIAAIAGARVHGMRIRAGLEAHAALSVSIEATFLLEELADSPSLAPDLQRLVRTRLARVRACALAEQCASEPDGARELLAFEPESVRAALARFPASCGHLGDAAQDGIAASSRFGNFPNSPLDGVPGGCWMHRVSSAETGVVSAQPRSEESC